MIMELGNIKYIFVWLIRLILEYIILNVYNKMR